MKEHFKITCPHCQTLLLVDRNTGEILDVRQPLVEKSTGDRFSDAMQKIKRDKQEAEQKFVAAQDYEKHKKEKLDELFSTQLKQAREQGDATPQPRDIDLE
jgi:Zn-finger nucleic acid-binding protein